MRRRRGTSLIGAHAPHGASPAVAAQFNKQFPYTAFPRDYERSFGMRSFSTQTAARRYARQQDRPYAICLPSGAIVEVG